MGGSREEASCFECDSHRFLPRSRPRRRCERRRRPGDSDQRCDDLECRTGSAYADRKRDGRARDVHRERERVRHRSDVVVGADVHGPVGQRQRRTHPYRCPRGRRTSVRAPMQDPARARRAGQRTSVPRCSRRCLQTGGTYANVHTSANGAGEIRGQIAVTASVTTALNARQEVPKPKGAANRARGTFTATVAKTDATTGAMAWRLTFQQADGSRRSGAHPHRGRRTCRPGRGSALRPVPERRPEVRDAAGRDARGSRGRPCVREHPHGAERWPVR